MLLGPLLHVLEVAVDVLFRSGRVAVVAPYKLQRADCLLRIILRHRLKCIHDAVPAAEEDEPFPVDFAERR